MQAARRKLKTRVQSVFASAVHYIKHDPEPLVNERDLSPMSHRDNVLRTITTITEASDTLPVSFLLYRQAVKQRFADPAVVLTSLGEIVVLDEQAVQAVEQQYSPE